MDLSEEDEALFASILEDDEDGLLDLPEKPKKVTTEDRLERGFLEIVDFFREHQRIPSSSTRNIAERKLGARLDGFLASPERAEAVRHLDEFDLLTPQEAPTSIDDLFDEEFDDLLNDDAGLFDLSGLPVTRETREDAEVAQREPAKDFETFEPLFKAKHEELSSGVYTLAPFDGLASIKVGRFFVLNGVMLFIAEVGEREKVPSGNRERTRERLRIIFENGTESAMYRSSLAIQLGQQDGRALVRLETSVEEIAEGDEESGHIYVLKSLSKNPEVAGLKHLYKIGFTRGTVDKRIAHAEHDPTYLMAPVEVVADYRVYNVRPSVLEKLLHRVFASVRLNITQIDTKGNHYDPSEWFVVPIDVIDEAITKIIRGDIIDFIYDRSTQQLVPVPR